MEAAAATVAAAPAAATPPTGSRAAFIIGAGGALPAVGVARRLTASRGCALRLKTGRTRRSALGTRCEVLDASSMLITVVRELRAGEDTEHMNEG
jgi:hypothetical protein